MSEFHDKFMEMIVTQIVSYINLEKIREINRAQHNETSKIELFKQVVLDECNSQDQLLKIEIKETFAHQSTFLHRDKSSSVAMIKRISVLQNLTKQNSDEMGQEDLTQKI